MSSAPKTITAESEKNSAGGSGLARANPVALEVPVRVTGARAGNAGARELFTEEAQTVLVFRDGAVIRLTGAVSEGQLLFMTNKESKEEVVCQVLHTREAGPASAYVELLFSEEKPDFWGASFEASRAVTAFQRQDQVEAEKTTVAEPGATAEPRKRADVDHLKKEVELLRNKLFDSAKGIAAAGKSGTNSDAPLLPGAGESHEPARAMVGMSLPIAKLEGEKDPTEELLPKPELDFSHAPSGEVRQNALRKPLRPPRVVAFKKVLVPAFCLLVLALGAVAWTAKPWNYFGALKAMVLKPRAPKSGKPSEALSRAGVAAATRAAVGVLNPPGNAGKAAAKSDAAKSPSPAMPEKNAAVAVPGSKESSAKTKTGAANAGIVAANPSGGTENPLRRVVPPNGTAEKKAVELGVNNATVLPAKLLKAANPVYPPDAMRSFITGDVRAEAVVEPDGHVGEVKILSGPKPLRDAAIDALKQYHYAPATQGGKSVASKVTVTVKFWFNP